MDLSLAQNVSYFNDLSDVLSSGKTQSTQRVQLKMPKRVVQALDKLFPHMDRSYLISQLATLAISQQLKFQDRRILRELALSQQSGLNDMINYLEDRDAGVS